MPSQTKHRVRFSRWLRVSGTLLCFCLLAHSAGGSEKPATVPENKGLAQDQIRTVTYHVGDLVRVRFLWRQQLVPGFTPSQAEGIDALAQTIVAALGSEHWNAKRGKDNLQELNGTELEIRTSVENHGMIEELLAALRRLADVSVVVDTELYELEREFYQHQIEPVLGKDKDINKTHSAVLINERLAKELRSRANRLRSNKITIPNQEPRKTFSWRTAFTYHARSKPSNVDRMQIGFQGVWLETEASVTLDRRFVDITLTEHNQELLDIGKEAVFDSMSGKERTIEVPNLLTRSNSMRVRAEDTQPLIMPIDYRPSEIADANHRLLLLIRPTVFIEEEEKQKRGN